MEDWAYVDASQFYKYFLLNLVAELAHKMCDTSEDLSP